MARINPELLGRLLSATRKSPRQVYRLIEAKVRETSLPPRLAAVALAMDLKLNVHRYATEAELAEIRHGGSLRPIPIPGSLPRPLSAGKRIQKNDQREAKKRGTAVFVVHGRNEKTRRALFSFLRAVGLKPIEWRKAIEYTGKPSPYVGEILDAAFKKATAVVVLLTPDEEGRVKPVYLKPSDPSAERELRGQPRLNVLFEAGMAFGRYPQSTILVQVGETRAFSDIAGRHVVHLDNSAEKRQELITKLKSCGCIVDDSGSDWLSEGDFALGK